MRNIRHGSDGGLADGRGVQEGVSDGGLVVEKE